MKVRRMVVLVGLLGFGMKSGTSVAQQCPSGEAAQCPGEVAPNAIALGAQCPAGAVDDFRYMPPGELQRGNPGFASARNYLPGMRFPLRDAPAYANSQKPWCKGANECGWKPGCPAESFEMPWWDTFCEARTDPNSPLCLGGQAHQGVDIRACTCLKEVHPAVAVEDGVLTKEGVYSLTMFTEDGRRHRYLHMKIPGEISQALESGRHEVRRGDRVGWVSDEFGDELTSVHLHYDVSEMIEGYPMPVYLPPYMSLVRAYEALIGVDGMPEVQVACAVGSQPRTLDQNSRCFELHGDPMLWREIGGQPLAHGHSLRWTRAWAGLLPSNWAEWQLDFSAEGTYVVEVHNVLFGDAASSERAPWAVYHAGERSDVRVDMSESGGWIELGEFFFEAGAAQSVAVFDNSGETPSQERRIVVDGIRVTAMDGYGPTSSRTGSEGPATDNDGPSRLAQTDGGLSEAVSPDAGPCGDGEVDAGPCRGCSCRVGDAASGPAEWAAWWAAAGWLCLRRRRWPEFETTTPRRER